MAEREVDVYVQIADEDVLAGRLWSHRARGTESMTFRYAEEYLGRRDAYALDPVQLDLFAGPQQTPQGRAIFGAFSDTAPDRWGRRLIDRTEAKAAKTEGRAPRSFGEIDYLLGVRDDLRQGALRFRAPGASEFLACEEKGVPALTDLPPLLSAAEKIERGQETRDELAVLMRAGSSLGGARPKAHVQREDGTLAIAKFPSPNDDDWDVMRWEAVALQLARDARIIVPNSSLLELDGKWVLIVDRFDRAAGRRIGYVSGLAMLGLHNGDRASYPELADVVRTGSPRARADLHELWRRVALSILISNFDDHLRNHGFLRTSTAGWSLSPAFDINPDPRGGGYLHTAVDIGDDTADVDLLLSVIAHFDLDREEAIQILSEVSAATSRWREVATDLGLADEIERMEPAFEHEAAETARARIAP